MYSVVNYKQNIVQQISKTFCLFVLTLTNCSYCSLLRDKLASIISYYLVDNLRKLSLFNVINLWVS